MSWLLLLLEHWSIRCTNPCGFKGTWLRNFLSSIPVIMYGQFTIAWKHQENVSFVRHPTRIKIENKSRGNIAIMITHAAFSAWMTGDLGPESSLRGTRRWQVGRGLIHLFYFSWKTRRISSKHNELRPKNVGWTCGQTQQVMGGRRNLVDPPLAP